MKTEEQVKNFIKERVQEIESIGFENIFPRFTREEDYKPYFKNNDDLEKWLYFAEDDVDLEIVAMNQLFLEYNLKYLHEARMIEFYEKNGTEYMVRTPRYDVYLKVLHFGDIAQYTVNRKTNKKGNYLRSMLGRAIQNNLQKYL